MRENDVILCSDAGRLTALPSVPARGTEEKETKLAFSPQEIDSNKMQDNGYSNIIFAWSKRRSLPFAPEMYLCNRHAALELKVRGDMGNNQGTGRDNHSKLTNCLIRHSKLPY